jgi:arsenical pump membrane protein
MVLTLCIFVLTLILVMARPRPLNEATAASLGAFLMLATGVVSLMQAYEVLRASVNILLFFLGLMLVSAVADRAGFFEWSAIKAVKLANGNGRSLLLIVFGLGVVVTAFFSNDATALILTPVVYVLVTRLRLNPLPFVFACAFVANTASMILPVSNPVNLLPVDRFGLTLGEYLRFLLLPSLLVISLNVALFAIIFRKQVSASFNCDLAEYPVKVDPFFLFVCGGLALTALGYILTSIYGLPLSVPALAGAAVLLAGGFGSRRLNVRHVGSSISWSILLFILSLALLVKGLENAGVTHTLGEALAALSSRGTMQAVVSTSFCIALGSNLINNWSAMMVSVSSLGSISNPALSSDPSLIYATILGADLGPNIAIIGSLSSMLWLVLLRRRGLDIHPLQYLKLGLMVTPLILIVGALSLYACRVFWG